MKHVMRPEIEARFAASADQLRGDLTTLMGNLRIPEPVDICDWIEANVRRPRAVTSGGGSRKLRLYGYQRQIARLAVHPDTKELVAPKGTRTGITQEFAAIDAYHVFYEGKPVGMWQPTEEKAKKYATSYWLPMVKESPKLRRFLRRIQKGDIPDRWNWQQFTNGAIYQTGFASSDDQFRGDTLAITNGDEVDADGWRQGKKGSQGAKFKLMSERSRTFWDRKQYLWSSPLEEETSNIWKRWLLSDQRHYMVRCPHCDGVQYLKWGGPKTDFGIKWSVNEAGYVDDAWYVCEHNGCIIQETEKFAMDDEAGDAIYGPDDPTPMHERLGYNQPTKVAARPGLVGVHVPGYISLFAGAKWTTLAQEWLDAQGDVEELQTFVNNVLGEPWRVQKVNRDLDVGSFEQRRPVPFAAPVPEWAKFCTMYVDLQDGWADETLKLPERWEAQVVAWGPGYEAALVGHFVIMDHPAMAPESLAALDDIAFRTWTRAGDGAKLRCALVGMDASHRQTEVMAVIRAPHRAKIFRAMKGESETTREKAPIIIGAAKLDDKRTQLIKIGTRRAKDLADRMIRNETPGPFHLHIPQSAAAIDTDDGRPKFFDSLLAEKKVMAAGIETWKRKSKMNTGEVWDCLVGNIAVAELASRQWGKVIGRILTDMTPQPPRERYEGEDHSIMAEVLAYQQTREFQGDETISILPPAGDVRVPGRKVIADPAAELPDPVQQRAEPPKRGGLQARSGGLQVGPSGKLRFGTGRVKSRSF